MQHASKHLIQTLRIVAVIVQRRVGIDRPHYHHRNSEDCNEQRYLQRGVPEYSD
jgi:hypothetical protein